MGRGIDILVVDDNASIRELLLQSLAPLGAVEAAGNGWDALARVEKQAPELVVCDYRMPGLSGVDLLAKLSGLAPGAAVVMMASRADLGGPLASSRSRVEEFIEKPFFVEEAAACIKRVVDRIQLSKATREAADSTSVRGTLTQMSVMDLLQTLDIGRKSCSLVISHADQQCEMLFHEGQIVHATLGAVTGEEAVYKVVAWTEGAFRIDFEFRQCPRTIQHSTQSVLMEALRIFDEAQRDAGEEDSGGPSKPAPGPASPFGF